MKDLAILIPILALAIPVSAVIMNGMVRIWRLRVEEARARSGDLGGAGAEELASLRAEVNELRAELGDVQERLDFAERALVQSRERQRLPGESA